MERNNFESNKGHTFRGEAKSETISVVLFVQEIRISIMVRNFNSEYNDIDIQ